MNVVAPGVIEGSMARDAFPAGLPAEVVERLLGGNARETYRVGVAA